MIQIMAIPSDPAAQGVKDFFCLSGFRHKICNQHIQLAFAASMGNQRFMG
jgi:hypothetical protein